MTAMFMPAHVARSRELARRANDRIPLPRSHPSGLFWLTREESARWDHDDALRKEMRRLARGRTIVKDGGKPVDS